MVTIESDGTNWYIGAGNNFIRLNKEGDIEYTQVLSSDIVDIFKSKHQIHINCTSDHYIINNSGEIENSSEWKQVIQSLNIRDIYMGNTYDFYYATEEHLLGYNINDQSSNILINWVNSSIIPQDIVDIVDIDEETIYIYSNDSISNERGLWKYVKEDEGKVYNKEIINISYKENGEYDIPLAAIKFNNSQDEYHIVCNETSGKFTDITESIYINDNIDIIALNSIDEYIKYSDAGILTDLYSLEMESNILNREDIFGCVRDAFERDEKLFGLPSEFTLKTYSVKSNAIPEDVVWNVQTLINMLDPSSRECRLLESMNFENIYNEFIYSILSDYVSWKEKMCSFTTASFVDYLELLSILPETDEFEGDGNLYASDEVILYPASIGNFVDYAQAHYVFGDDKSYIIGYPSSDGSLSKLNASKIYTITENSNSKKGALTFIKYLCSAECVINEAQGMRSIPALKNTMNAWSKVEKGMFYYIFLDEVGRYKGSKEMMSEITEGVPGICVLIDDTFINTFESFLDNINVCTYIPQTVIDIVNEEISVYCNTKRSAEETSKIIQSRVSIYLSEQG